MPSLDLGPVVGPQGEQGATGAQGIRGEQGLPGPNQVTNSTATPLTGILTGNGSVVGVANIDAEPTAGSTGFAQSGGTDKAIKGRVPVYGLGKNLLDNWYFGNPVNQRGQSSYSDAVYTVDRWQLRRSGTSVTVQSDGIELGLGSSSAVDIGQFIEQSKIDFLMGKTVTASWIDSDGFHTVSFVWAASVASPYSSDSVSFYAGYNASNIYNFLFAYKVTGKTLIAAKLELGTEQTLCHNEGTDANPVWVLNEVPDYEYELYRCMTSTGDSTDTYANKTLATGQELAYVENGTTATKTNGYAAGEYFCWHGLLHRAKTAIGNGDTFTENTNCEQVTEGGLNALKSCFPWKSLGIAYNDTPLNTNFASYNELLIILLVNGSIQYGTYVIPVESLSNSLFLSIYESQTHHASLQITTNSAKTQISLAYNGAIAGWNSVVARISAR